MTSNTCDKCGKGMGTTGRLCQACVKAMKEWLAEGKPDRQLHASARRPRGLKGLRKGDRRTDEAGFEDPSEGVEE